MKLVTYSAELQGALISGLDRAGLDAPLLRIQSYVKHYYLSYPGCRLTVLVDAHGEIAATLGSEHVKLRVGRQTFDAVVMTSTYSLQPGAFALLFFQWMKSAELGLVFAGNALLDNLLARQKRWVAVRGLSTYWLNWGYPAQPDDPSWKKLLKPMVRWIKRSDASSFVRRLRAHAPTGLTLREVSRFDDGMTQRGGTFGLRLEPDSAFLNWRFDTTLDYVRYRIFCMELGGRTCGYVVIAEWPHCLVVSHGDAQDAQTLACAILLAIARINQGANRYRKVLLSCMHTGMLPLLRRFGFEPAPRETPFYMAAFGDRGAAAASGDDWIVNLDLGDTGTVLGMVYKP